MFSGLLSHSAAPAADFSRLQRASITFRDVAKRYGDHQVLNAINLQVEPGEVVAILGPFRFGKIDADPLDQPARILKRRRDPDRR